MISRDSLSAFPIRVLVLGAIAAAIALTFMLGRSHPQHVAANPAYGAVKLNPSSGFVIQGYKIGVPVNLTTCSTPPPTYTPTATATKTATPTRTSTATPITNTPTATFTITPILATATKTFTPTITNTPFPGTPLPSPTISPFSICGIGSYDVNLNFDSAKLSVISVTGTSTSSASAGVNTTTTLVDAHRKADTCLAEVGSCLTPWKIGQWAGSGVILTAGGGSDGATGPQIRKVISNTSYSLTVSPAWDGFPVSFPDNTTVYTVGGMTDGGWITNNGTRGLQCPVGPTYGSNWAELHCVSTGGTAGATGAGALTNLTLSADNRGLALFTFTLPPAVNGTRILTIEGNDIPADVINGARRVTLCPDPSGDGKVNSTDQLLMAQAFNKHTGDPLYTQAKDPDENGVINSTDQLIAAGEFNKKCIQP